MKCTNKEQETAECEKRGCKGCYYNDEIKVGEYVRYSDGDLINADENAIDYYNYVLKKGERLEDGNRKIVKHSKNIIDLIEVGDYVNGEKVSNVDKIDNENVIEWENGDMYKTTIQNDKFIKSIVTHEQFKSIEYIVKE